MIRRPNVRARCYRLNVQIAHHANYRFGRRVRNCYFRQCRWCRRPITGGERRRYPHLCEDCFYYLHDLEADHFIKTRYEYPGATYDAPKRILQVPPFQDERPS